MFGVIVVPPRGDVSVLPEHASTNLVSYKVPFDVAAALRAAIKTGSLVRKIYNLEGYFGDRVIECFVVLVVQDLPTQGPQKLEQKGKAVERREGTLHLVVKEWRSDDISGTVKITGFNTAALTGRIAFELGNIAKYAKDPLYIDLEFKRSLFDEPSALRSDLGSVLSSGKHSDVAVECGGRVFTCHKVILSARSDFFAAMFESDFRENAENRVVVKDVDSEVMEALLKYIYTGGVSWVSISVELLKAADMYLVSGLKRQCCKVLSKSVTASNCCQMLEVGDRFDDELFDSAIEVLVANAQSALQSDEWKAMAGNRELWKRVSESLLDSLSQRE